MSMRDVLTFVGIFVAYTLWNWYFESYSIGMSVLASCCLMFFVVLVMLEASGKEKHRKAAAIMAASAVAFLLGYILG